MNTQTNGDSRELNSPDLPASANIAPPLAHEADRPVMVVTTAGVVRTTREKALAPLFTQHAMADFRSRWDVIQIGFVDDPEQAVRAGDDLVSQVIKSLSDSFSAQRTALEGE